MKFKLGAALVFFGFLLLPGIAMGHPLKLSASLVEYDPETKSLRMECKVFRDDFERSLHRTVLKGIDPATIKQDEKSKIIDSFFKNFYTIALNGKVLPLKLEAYTKFLKGNDAKWNIFVSGAGFGIAATNFIGAVNGG